jgi:hypothetical protein
MSDGTETVVATFGKNSREMVRVALTQFRGVKLISIRVWVPRRDGSGTIPTRAGIDMRVEKLPELRAAIVEAEAQARAAGLLPTDSPADR